MSGWTEEKDARLNKLWQDGYSASQIAWQIPGTTRNAVLGRIHRLGIAARCPVPRKKSVHKAPRKVRKRRTQTPPARSDAISSRQSTERATPEPDRSYSVDPVTGPLAHDDDPDFIGPRLRMTVRTMPLHGACRWPIGSADEPGFHFCGRHCEAGDSYCEFHARIAYAPSSRSSRKKPNPNRPYSPKTSPEKEIAHG